MARGLPFEIEQRARRKDGQYRWFLIRFNPFRDEEGRLVRWYATGTDIDDRKRAEDRTRNENVALREEHRTLFDVRGNCRFLQGPAPSPGASLESGSHGFYSLDLR